MEYAEGGDLMELIERHRREKTLICEDEILRITR
jgi:serine/threonine protein kinase